MAFEPYNLVENGIEVDTITHKLRLTVAPRGSTDPATFVVAIIPIPGGLPPWNQTYEEEHGKKPVGQGPIVEEVIVEGGDKGGTSEPQTQ